MHLDTRLGTPESRPVKEFQTERNGAGIKGIVLSVKHKLTANPGTLCKIDHVVGEAFKKTVVSELVCFGKGALVHRQTAKSKMERLAAVCGGKIRQLAKTATPF